MKKILILANNDVGLYKFRKELIQELLKENKVYISLPYGKFVDNLVDMGCEFIDTTIDRRGMNPRNDLNLLIQYFKIISRIKPNIIITYTIKPNIYGGIASRILKHKYFVNITGLGSAFQNDNFTLKVIKGLYKFALKNASKVFFENEGNKEIFLKNLLTSPEKVVKLNGAGVNLDDYNFVEYPKEDAVIKFLFIGRIMKEKGIEELLEAAIMIKEKYQNIEFNIVGPLEENYKDIIDEYSSNRTINYYGYQSDVKRFIKESHCIILPSYHEGMSNVLLEAGIMGRPLITSNIYGCREAVVENQSGYLVDIKSAVDIAHSIEKYYLLKREDRINMANKSYEHIKNNFERNRVVNQTVKELNQDE